MLVMGILNLTPDSFADGGRHNSFEAGVARGLEMIAEGVDIIDIGGESTRPGADRVSADEEQARVLPVIKELAKSGVKISIDTMRADTAEKAVQAGAAIINDVSGGLSDPAMFATVKKLGVAYILMHWRGQSKDMNSRAVYSDVVTDVISELNSQIDAALDAGINKSQIIIDPGLGFAKDAEHNWEILRNLKAFTELGYPVLIGASRKRFLGGDNPDEREAATIELTKTLVPQGIWGVRVHSVKPHVDVIAGAK
ncbi:MAG: dihydropteroate synthase [Actinobacteria bacterium]|jgi:dihydropteroate synthase|nr:dihydropteroate synthase [Actinomycetota bacterium]NDH81494.1 dihydropteroate synthase [Actinomycetota bacterium]NDI07889.1 dihydropteroate synthase [Actinomycetota bacterium]